MQCPLKITVELHKVKNLSNRNQQKNSISNAKFREAMYLQSIIEFMASNEDSFTALFSKQMVDGLLVSCSSAAANSLHAQWFHQTKLKKLYY